MATKTIHHDQVGKVTIYKRRGTSKVTLKVVNNKIKIIQPTWLPYAAGKNFLADNIGWLKKQSLSNEQKIIESGQKIGKNHDIYFHADNKLRSRVHESTIDIFYDQASQGSFSPEVQLLAKKAIKRAVNIEANQYLPSRLESVANSIDCNYKSLTIKPMKSRWGSCSSKQEIKLNCYLMFMPWEVIDYVLVHELSHTKHLNHSSSFWQMVEENLPDYKARKKTLKIMQAEVSAFQI